MNVKIYIMFISFLLLISFVSAFGSENQKALLGSIHYYSGSSLAMCNSKIEIYYLKKGLNKPVSITSIYDCIDERKKVLKEEYKKIASSDSINERILELVKKYYVANVSALDSYLPRTGESKLDYDNRREDADHNVKEVWYQLEIVAGL